MDAIRKRDTHCRLAFEDIAADDFNPAKYGLTLEETIRAMHAVKPDGSLLIGIDALAAAYEAVGWNWLAKPLRWPLTRPLAMIGYRLFASIRPRLSSFKAPQCARDRCKVPS